jgi:hypothetical protein
MNLNPKKSGEAFSENVDELIYVNTITIFVSLTNFPTVSSFNVIAKSYPITQASLASSLSLSVRMMSRASGRNTSHGLR